MGTERRWRERADIEDERRSERASIEQSGVGERKSGVSVTEYKKSWFRVRLVLKPPKKFRPNFEEAPKFIELRRISSQYSGVCEEIRRNAFLICRKKN